MSLEQHGLQYRKYRRPKNITDYQSIIAEIETVIGDDKTLLTRFEATGCDETLSDDYLALHELYTRVVEEQRRYTQAMLAAEE